MKTQKLTCRECKKKFTVMVKKELPIMRSVMGLPNCKHHGGKDD